MQVQSGVPDAGTYRVVWPTAPLTWSRRHSAPGHAPHGVSCAEADHRSTEFALLAPLPRHAGHCTECHRGVGLRAIKESLLSVVGVRLRDLGRRCDIEKVATRELARDRIIRERRGAPREQLLPGPFAGGPMQDGVGCHSYGVALVGV